MKGKDFLVSNPNVFRKSFKAGDTDFMPNSLTSEATETVLRDKTRRIWRHYLQHVRLSSVVWMFICENHVKNTKRTFLARLQLLVPRRSSSEGAQDATRTSPDFPWVSSNIVIIVSNHPGKKKKKGSIYTIRLRSLTWLQGRWILTLLTKPIFYCRVRHRM